MNLRQEQGARTRRSLQARALWIGIIAGMTTIALVPLVGEGVQMSDPGYRYSPEATPVPVASAQNQTDGQDAKAKDPEAANAARKKQFADDTAKLLKLATDLKLEVDKTSKDTLSLNVIRKADEIEKLAHDVKERMRLTVGPG
ncbi:MAG: hypothetical protein WBQ94_22825 [Terracidiphilus sp.]